MAVTLKPPSIDIWYFKYGVCRTAKYVQLAGCEIKSVDVLSSPPNSVESFGDTYGGPGIRCKARLCQTVIIRFFFVSLG